MNFRQLTLVTMLTICTLFLFPIAKDTAAKNGLQQLIDKASNGDTIFLEAGLYHGPIEITKPLTIKAENGATIQGNGKGSALVIKETSDVTLDGLTIENGGRKGTNAAVYVEEAEQITLKNNTLRQFRHGIYATKVEHLTVHGNTFVGNHDEHFSKKGNGIFLFHTSGSNIAENKIQFVQDGIYVESDKGSRFHHNEVTDSRYGIHFMYSHDSEVVANEFHHNVVGMMVMVSSDLSFIGNVATNHFHYNGAGAVIFDCKRVDMYENELANNSIGLSLQDVSHSFWQKNQLYNNRIGLELKKYGKENRFSENRLTGNVMQVVSASKNVSLHGEGVGNYWDDYRGYDFDRNGIGDTAYIPSNTYAHLVGKKQAYQFFFETPAVTVMNVLDQKLAPSKDEQEVYDPAPLMTKDYSFEQETSITFSPFTLGIGVIFIIVGFSIFYKRRYA